MPGEFAGASTVLSKVIAAGESGSALWVAVSAYLQKWATWFMRSESRLQRHLDSGELVNQVFGEVFPTGLQRETPSACKRQLKYRLSRRVLDAARRNRRRQVDDADHQLANLAAADSEPNWDRQEGIELCLSKLEEGQRRLLYRRYVEDASFKELEVEFNCSRGTVHRHLVQARAQLSEVAKRLGLDLEA